MTNKSGNYILERGIISDRIRYHYSNGKRFEDKSLWRQKKIKERWSPALQVPYGDIRRTPKKKKKKNEQRTTVILSVS